MLEVSCVDIDHAIAISEGVLIALAEHMNVHPSLEPTSANLAGYYFGAHATILMVAMQDMKNLHCTSS